MIVFPAIDIKEGNCVRLYKGDFSKSTIFNKSPLQQALKFKQEGFRNIHIVDLDAALGKKNNQKIILEIIKKTKLNIQLGGGIRNLRQISFWIKNGVSKVVVGTMAIKKQAELRKACKLYPGKIAVAMDVRNDFIAINGWIKQTKIRINKFIKQMENLDVSRIIYTDINRDGTKSGVNLKKIAKIVKITNIPIVISGGVSNLNDVINIKNSQIFDGVIIGKSIYDNSISLKRLKKWIFKNVKKKNYTLS
jgi:phosphoribosylformimino-5-aminoimidazole carboxamide ribotide isomerase